MKKPNINKENNNKDCDPIVKQVYQNSSNKQLLISLPRDSNFKSGDYVLIFKLKNEDLRRYRERFEEKSLNTS